MAFTSYLVSLKCFLTRGFLNQQASACFPTAKQGGMWRTESTLISAVDTHISCAPCAPPEPSKPEGRRAFQVLLTPWFWLPGKYLPMKHHCDPGFSTNLHLLMKTISSPRSIVPQKMLSPRAFSSMPFCNIYVLGLPSVVRSLDASPHHNLGALGTGRDG